MRLRISILLLLFLAVGCAPSARLTFPYRRLVVSSKPQWFSVHHHHDFGITFKNGRMDALLYDDNGDGKPDRVYHLRDYNPKNLPHFVLLLDSIPFKTMADRYAAGEFRWFDPPVKVIPPFPSLTKICYTQVLHAPPTEGMIDDYYNPAKGRVHSGFADRWIGGYREPWEHYLDYSANFADASEAYLFPRPWYAAELERAHKEFDESNRRTTVVYLASASCMVCRYGKEGANEVLDGAARLCLQLLYEREGAVEISMMADHGHNYMLSKNIDVAKILKEDGFHITDHLRTDNDVIPELSGLVTYAGIDTRDPVRVSDALLRIHGIEHTFYMSGDSVIVRDCHGYAKIDAKGKLLRYTAVTSDVLGYKLIIQLLRQHHKIDSAGFASPLAWFHATVNAEYPDAPPRLWYAFHGEAVHTPSLMFTTLDGYCAGLPYLKAFITMHSTHGSLNQVNSATFLVSMTHRTHGPLRSIDVMPTIAPHYISIPRRHVTDSP
ncbi:MAG TPA: hypothetical protein VG722_12445 [Tepidisphaeraceae bacterium]|nr:hypothetical protein [Tepidisphaeraceae bacterium]